eukprot:gene2518-14277_t
MQAGLDEFKRDDLLRGKLDEVASSAASDETESVGNDVARHLKEQRRQRRDKASFMEFVFALRRQPLVRSVEFHDSLHVTDAQKSESLLHHLKVTTVLDYRGSSTTGRVVLNLFSLSLWTYVYFALWQEILWEVVYLIMALTADWVVCMGNVSAVTILSHALFFVFFFYRMLCSFTLM